MFFIRPLQHLMRYCVASNYVLNRYEVKKHLAVDKDTRASKSILCLKRVSLNTFVPIIEVK